MGSRTTPKQDLFVHIVKNLVAERDKQVKRREPQLQNGPKNQKLQKPIIFKRHGEVNLLQANLMFEVYRLRRRAENDSKIDFTETDMMHFNTQIALFCNRLRGKLPITNSDEKSSYQFDFQNEDINSFHYQFINGIAIARTTKDERAIAEALLETNNSNPLKPTNDDVSKKDYSHWFRRSIGEKILRGIKTPIKFLLYPLYRLYKDAMKFRFGRVVNTLVVGGGGGLVGWFAGAAAGAAMGATLGSFFPIIGNIVGAILGAAIITIIWSYSWKHLRVMPANLERSGVASEKYQSRATEVTLNRLDPNPRSVLEHETTKEDKMQTTALYLKLIKNSDVSNECRDECNKIIHDMTGPGRSKGVNVKSDYTLFFLKDAFRGTHLMHVEGSPQQNYTPLPNENGENMPITLPAKAPGLSK